MTKKADFNAEEWTTVVEGPLLAGVRVIASERGGSIRESMALGKAYAEARRQQGQSELLDALASERPTMDADRLSPDGGDLAGVADKGLRDAVQVVSEKGTAEELEAYRQFVLTVAQAVANAHKEGGFLGIGGTPVSEAEQAALDEVAAILNGPSAA